MCLLRALQTRSIHVSLVSSISLFFSLSLSRWHVNGAPIVKEMEEEEKETDDETSFEIGNLSRPSRRLFKGWALSSW